MMKLAIWKRTALGTLVAMSVVAGSLTAFAGQASADGPRGTCHGPNIDCGVPRSEN
jgi:hypothetical protein